MSTVPVYDWFALQKLCNNFLMEVDGHWIWTGDADGNKYGSYGVFTRGNKGTGLLTRELRAAGLGKRETAQRAAYKLLVGPIPEGYEVDHLCRVRMCVNPDHLEAVTSEENKRRAAAWKKSLTRMG